MVILTANGECAKDDRIGCDETPFAAEKYDGIDGTRQNQSSLLHFDTKYHSGAN